MNHDTQPLPLDAYRPLVTLDVPFQPLLPMGDVPLAEELVQALIAAIPDNAWGAMISRWPVERIVQAIS